MAIGDQYWSKVVLACHFDGGNNSTTFTDEVGNEIVPYGNTKISTAQSKFGGSCANFDGAGDYLAVADRNNFDFETGDFTVEVFFRTVAHTTAMTIVGNYEDSTQGWALQIRGDASVIRFGLGDSALLDVSWLPDDGVWYHLAVCRGGGLLRIFIDGVQIGPPATNSTNIAGSKNSLLVGGLALNSVILQSFHGQLDDLRITRAARYTDNFTPPTGPFKTFFAQLQGTVEDSNGNFTRRLVRAHRRSDGVVIDETLSSPSTGGFTLNTQDAGKHYIVVHDSDAWITYLPFNGDDNSTLFYEWGGRIVTPHGAAKISTAQSKFGGASAYFDGNGDYLSLTDANDFSLGSIDFTIECWVRPAINNALQAIVDTRGTVNDYACVYVFMLSASGKVQFSASAASAGTIGAAWDVNMTGATTVLTDEWHHVAIVRAGSSWNIFLNGVMDGSATASLAIGTTSDTAFIGGGAISPGTIGYYFNGYIDDLKISKGVARYSNTFTPPIAPHGAGLQLQNAIIYDHLTPV